VSVPTPIGGLVDLETVAADVHGVGVVIDVGDLETVHVRVLWPVRAQGLRCAPGRGLALLAGAECCHLPGDLGRRG